MKFIPLFLFIAILFSSCKDSAEIKFIKPAGKDWIHGVWELPNKDGCFDGFLQRHFYPNGILTLVAEGKVISTKMYDYNGLKTIECFTDLSISLGLKEFFYVVGVDENYNSCVLEHGENEKENFLIYWDTLTNDEKIGVGPRYFRMDEPLPLPVPTLDY